MFIFLLLFVYYKNSAGVPLLGDQTTLLSTIVSRDQSPDSQCLDLDHCRTAQGIIWSCLVTVFACTWVAVHPNLPGPKDSGWVLYKRQIVTMIYALLAPEFMTWWAMRQRVGVGSIVQKFNEKFHGDVGGSERSLWASFKRWINGEDNSAQPGTWALTHGFFLQMGGFVLYQHGKPICVLTLKRMVALIEAGDIDVPMVTEREINDKSKGDLLAKSFVVLQTSWFVVQCLARWASRLPVTEMEVVTLAFAALNVITYILWWKKPQSVQVGIRIELKGGVCQIRCQNCLSAMASASSINVRQKARPQVDQNCGEGGPGAKEVGTNGACNKQTWVRQRLKWCFWAAEGGSWFAWAKFIFLHVPTTLIRGLLRPLYKMAGDVDVDVDTGSTRLPMFYAHSLGSQSLFSAIAFLFGGLHLISWSASFPSHIEQLLWRICALFITTEPAILLLYRRFWTHEMNNLIDLAVMASLGIYFVARLALVVLSCTAFRALPLDAYKTVEWSSFVPHI